MAEPYPNIREGGEGPPSGAEGLILPEVPRIVSPEPPHELRGRAPQLSARRSIRGPPLHTSSEASPRDYSGRASAAMPAAAAYASPSRGLWALSEPVGREGEASEGGEAPLPVLMAL